MADTDSSSEPVDTGDATDEAAPDPRPFSLLREAGGVLLIALALCVFLALISFQSAEIGGGSTENMVGLFGVYVGDALLYLFGLAAFCFDALIWYLGFNLLIGRRADWQWMQIAGQGLLLAAGTVVAHLSFPAREFFEHRAGGIVGSYAGEIMRSLFGTVGASILSGAVVLLGLMLVTQISLGQLLRSLLGQVHRGQAWLRHKWRVHREYRQRLAAQREKIDRLDEQALQEAARAEAELTELPVFEDDYDFDGELEQEVEEKLSGRLTELLDERLEDLNTRTDGSGSADDDSPESTADRATRGSDADDGDDSASPTDPSEGDADGVGTGDATSGAGDGAGTDGDSEDDRGSEPDVVVHDPPSSDVPDPPEPPTDDGRERNDTVEVSDADVVDVSEPEDGGEETGPEIVESEAQQEARARSSEIENEEGMLFQPDRADDWELPPLKFLNYDREDVGIAEETLHDMAREIEETLDDFNIEGSVVEICPGPVITMFEFEPAPGVKISKISSREADLAMNLAAQSVRIVAPIPGKSVVGIEVSNPEREMVWLKEIIADESFRETDMDLPLALGKGTAGEIETTDLTDMPHLLVAGATGSGKSVAVNSMICSLLYTHSPDELQMIMVDPKMLEFSVYNGIPHLHLPVVTDAERATVALNWAVQEMEKRYEKLADLGVRDIRSYNERVEELTDQAEEDRRRGRAESEALGELGVDKDGNPEHTKLPYLVVVIDEFADLMMTSSNEVESAVARLAQKARAAGIHMILATQRPSTDVITGMIKANFPARIALRVTSNTDSRVILGNNGAENLLGNGDMLILPPGSSDLRRVHGAFVSDDEIQDVVDYVSEQGEAEYDESIVERDEDEEGDDESPLDRDWEKDEYYDDAVRLVVEKDKASISMIQRKLRVGYNRAARMVDRMEQQGVVGPSDGCTARDVLIDEVPEDSREDGAADDEDADGDGADSAGPDTNQPAAE